MFLGEKNYLSTSSNQRCFEIFLRNVNIDGEHEYTLILESISNKKEKETEFLRSKSLVFSKIAHESKNPLICISELAKEIKKKG
jgi:hypothetical protein